MSARPERFPRAQAQAVALEDGRRSWTYAALEREQAVAAGLLAAQGTRVLATLMDNAPAWVVVDRAAARAGVVHVPLPSFFTPQQLSHALRSAGDRHLAGATPAGGGARGGVGCGAAAAVRSGRREARPGAPARQCAAAAAGHGQDHVHVRDHRHAQGRMPHAAGHGGGGAGPGATPWSRWTSGAISARCRWPCCWKTSPASWRRWRAAPPASSRRWARSD